MMTIINPMDFPVTPPMDLNMPVDPSSGNRLTNSEISPHPLRLRSNRGVGLFGTRRNNSNGLIRMHEGVDLLAPVGEPVYAIADGVVVSKTDVRDSTTGAHLYWNLAIHHYPLELGMVSHYIHTETPIVNLKDVVASGQQIAEVAKLVDLESHLHFELRQLANPSTKSPGSSNESLPLDPTRALYDWEKRRFQNDAGSRHLPPKPRDRKIVRIEEIVRDRFLPFLFVKLEDLADDLYLPLYQPSEDELRLREMLLESAVHKIHVRVAWRKSLFWGEVINDRSNTSLMNVIAEVRLYLS